jgi:hypothetical protein
MEALPREILYMISNFLKPKYYISLCGVSKTINSKINNDKLYWKTRISIDYSKFILINSINKIIDYKSHYKILYKTLCIYCNTKTLIKHKFTKERVCKGCQIVIPRLRTMAKTKAKKDFLLSDKDLEKIHFIKCYNYYNRRNDIKIFLVTDLVALSLEKHGSMEQLNIIKENKKNKKFMRTLMYMTKYNILRSAMLVKYNIDIIPFSRYLNRYTEGKFSRYIMNIGVSQNKKLALDIMNMCIEMRFIVDRRMPLSIFKHSDFYSFLKDTSLTTIGIIEYKNDYINMKILEIINDNKEQFKRKMYIEKIFNNVIEYKLYSTDIRKYIEENIGDAKEILIDHIESEYISNLLGFKEFFCEFLSIDKSELKHKYRLFISNRFDKGEYIPEELLDRYSLRK